MDAEGPEHAGRPEWAWSSPQLPVAEDPHIKFEDHDGYGKRRHDEQLKSFVRQKPAATGLLHAPGQHG